MKKIALIALAASAAALATPAAAQSASGTVGVTGTVAAKCTAITPITGTITLNELALANGTVDAAFGAQTGGLTRSFTVNCTGATPSITVSSDALNHSTDPTTANGYTGRVHYTSTLVADKATTGTATAVYNTADVLPAATTTNLGAPLKNAASNVRVTVSTGHTTNATDLLKAGSYSSTISITVSPT
ncbi:MAG TPA: hypothetical protein VHG29_01755 [Novosphingobium sp.]|nr:hypothetical protein [Novosphingobium sp.]